MDPARIQCYAENPEWQPVLRRGHVRLLAVEAIHDALPQPGKHLQYVYAD